MLTDWWDKILHFRHDSVNPFVVGIIEGLVNSQVSFFCQLTRQRMHLPCQNFEGFAIKLCPVFLFTRKALGDINRTRSAIHALARVSANKAPALVADHFISSICAGVIDNLASVSLINVGAGLLYDTTQITRWAPVYSCSINVYAAFSFIRMSAPR